MKNLNLFILIGIALTALFFTSCDPTDPPVENVVEVTADITTPTTWTADKVYVISIPDLAIESTLTIEAGTVIKFPSSYKNISVFDGGKIIANGTNSNPVIFTSYKDDTNGGDTNGDGGTTIPAVGDWANIDLVGTTGSEFTCCKFLYGGNGSSPSPTLSLSNGAEAIIDRCTFSNNGGGQNGNLFVGALHAENAGNGTVITNNSFYNNVLPLTVSAEINTDNSNTFSYNGNGNTYHGIFVSGNIQENTSWSESDVAYIITSNVMQIASNVTLTLGDNVVLKFCEGCSMDIVGAESSLVNYNGSGVYYTSIKDDELKGDSNGDSNLSSPEIADWVGIYIYDMGTKAAGYADWPNIRYNDPNPTAKS